MQGSEKRLRITGVLIIFLSFVCNLGCSKVLSNLQNQQNNVPTQNTEVNPSGNVSQPATPGPDTLQVFFIDVGQGDSELIKTASGNYILIDANGTAAKEFLVAKGITKLKYLILSHPHFDHYSGMDDLIEAGIAVDNFYYGDYPSDNSTYLALISLLDSHLIPKGQLKRNDVLVIDNLTFNIYNPPTSFLNTASDVNDNSLVIRAKNRSGFSVLFMGDAEITSWSGNLSTVSSSLNSDILKAAHHGSRNGISSEIFGAISPFSVIISCGAGNTYGHPHAEALAIYKATSVFRTDINGTVTLYVTANAYSIKTDKTGDTTQVPSVPTENTPATPTNNGGSGHLLIYEVLFNPSGTESLYEWIQLYNPTGSSINLSTWKFTDNSGALETLSGSIASGGFYVIARDSSGFQSRYGQSANKVATFALANTDDLIKLYEGTILVDEVRWGVSGWSLSATDGSSIRRKNTTDSDTSADWNLNSSPVPGQ